MRRVLNYIDKWLDGITMYRLVLDFLFVLTGYAIVISLFGVLPFRPVDLIFSSLIIVIASWSSNLFFARLFRVPANVESVYITAFILAAIITPAISMQDFYFYVTVAVVAQASKYLLAWKGKHIFNPAAFAVVFTFFAINQGASWWVGTMWMLPVVVIGGLLIARKTQRFHLVISFLITALLALTVSSPATALIIMKIFLFSGPILFFAFIMLTEPSTSPNTRNKRIVYGAIVGLMFFPSLGIGDIYVTPEIALLVGNVFSYLVSPKGRYLLTLKSKQLIGDNTYELQFHSNRRLNFVPGQYMEWTLNDKKPDRRGNRRYFTIASAPSERDVRLGVKFYENSSTFKKNLFALKAGDHVMAGQLAGDFTLPEDPSKKLVFIAGGIGITPFRSMIKHLLDNNQKRDIVVFYSIRIASERAYGDILQLAQQELGIKVIESVTEISGRLTAEQIQSQVSDYKDRIFYLSGPQGMVKGFESSLQTLGVPHLQIKKDFFPGYV